MAALNGIKGRDCMFSRLLCDDIVIQYYFFCYLGSRS